MTCHVYVAGPYKGDGSKTEMQNARIALMAAHELRDLGDYHPLVPHRYLLDQLVLGLEEDTILRELCVADLSRCDCVWRLPGISSGADYECEMALSMDMPVRYAACAQTFHQQVIESREGQR